MKQTVGELADRFGVDPSNTDEALAPDFNVAPMKAAPVVVARLPRDAEGAAAPVRQVRTMRWGLVPCWAKEAKLGRMINARAESVHQKPAFRRAFATRRGIVPVSGFYEWFETQQIGRSGKPLKQPFYLHPKDADQVLALAGLYEFWRDKDKQSDDPDAWLITFTIITTNATDEVGHIHDRMPMTVRPEDWAAWLDPRLNKVDDIRGLMAPPPPGSLDIYPVSTAVNNVRDNGPELIQPVPAER